MKEKIIFVNNNMDIGGVQKSLVNLLKSIESEYEITLLLFSKSGEYIEEIPKSVEVVTCDSLFRCLGISQNESKKNLFVFLSRGFLALVTKILGRKYAMKFILHSQKRLAEEYDCAISFLQNGGNKSFYGGCNEFVIEKINAKKKIAFLHCDYRNCGSNTNYNNRLYERFDRIAACSEGCRKSFIDVMPKLEKKCYTVINCHDFKNIQELSKINTVNYSEDCINIVSVSRISNEKGIDRAIEAIKYVNDKKINIKYYIVGDGVLRPKIEQKIQEYGLSETIFLCGNHKNPYSFMRNADILFIPSYHEAAPLVIDEARCLRVPVLSTDTTSAQDMVLNRKIGWVCGNSQSEINTMLLRILSDPDMIKEYKKNMALKICDNKEAVDQFKALINSNDC